MAELIAEFFQVIGVDMTMPETLAELIPYLLTVFIGLALVCGVFAVLGKLGEMILDYRWWK